MAIDLIRARQRHDVWRFGQIRTVADPDHHWVPGDGTEPVVADDDDVPRSPEPLMRVYVAAIHAAPFPASGVLKSCSLASAHAAHACPVPRSNSATVAAASRCTFSLADRDIHADIGRPASSAAALACRYVRSSMLMLMVFTAMSITLSTSFSQ